MDERIVSLSEEIIAAVKSQTVKDRDELQNFKLKLCKKYGLEQVPMNSEILANVLPEDRKLLTPYLIKKPMRTMSGVAVVAVMSSPFDCPHGKCAYCPGGVAINSPQSYTGKEPAARRAGRNDFDPYRQVMDRITQLTEIGHQTDKIDLIIMGGTFTCRDPEYQEWFVRRCFDAMNGVDSLTLGEAQTLNEHSEHRCIGLTVETRPDVFDDAQIERSMRLGATRVELGVQILDDDILDHVDRGHRTDAVRDCTKRCKDHGLKVCYHLMPGLPGSSPEHDLECFRKVFDSSDYRPDMLKFYPTLVVEGTKVLDWWKEGSYKPLDTEEAVDLLCRMKETVPEYVRIQRIQRDIPVPQITAGIMKSNIRQLVAEEMERRGRPCRCIRCREVGHRGITLDDPDKVQLKITEYDASGGKEYFVAMEYEDSIVGYVRVRIDSNPVATIRELKVFGKIVSIGEDGEDWQHRGYGKSLVREAERIAKDNGKSGIRVTSGVGVRQYYASLGFAKELPYMQKGL
ncbi:MAG: tRNA uridine(34) 5-carboxymethylaminomethyl modification radical SAM/GNAT enzyme Elp3 [Candidatus Methanomethylophilaceae archaeon]|nr:tRNA uridine(34) 5-carboxymethylaminomethyl modification radical SAM/GNAT enzyme Elp3 [Candidatus Methanomethylophilaceae archaeon]